MNKTLVHNKQRRLCDDIVGTDVDIINCGSLDISHGCKIILSPTVPADPTYQERCRDDAASRVTISAQWLVCVLCVEHTAAVMWQKNK